MRIARWYSLLLFICFVSKGQHNLDSLRNIINESQNDSIKVMAYTHLSNAFITKPQKALEILSEMESYCTTIPKDRDKALCLRKMGALYSFLNYFDKALEYTFKAADLFEKTGDRFGLSYCYNNIGNFYNYKGNYTQDDEFQKRSVAYHLKSISLRDTLTDSIPLMNSYNNIGNSYMALRDYDMALKYFNKAMFMYEKSKDANGIDMIYGNMGDCYLKMALIDNDKFFFQKALDIFLGRLKYYSEANPNSRYSNVLTRIGQIYAATGHAPISIPYLEKALDITRKIEDKREEMFTSEQLALAYEKVGNYPKALEMMKWFNSLKDELVNQQNSEGIEQMQALYQTSQKDREIEKLHNEKVIKDAEIQRHRNMIITSIVVILLVVVLIVVILSRYNLKRKANLKLSEAYQNIEIKNKQITDSINYSRRIQNSILPPKAMVCKHLKSFFAFYAPKDIVSGDFYWHSFSQGINFLVLADCTGHGVPGALMSMVGNTLLNETINQKNIADPGEILNHLNKGVINALRQHQQDPDTQEDGMDISLVKWNPEKPEQIEYACANHNIFIKSSHSVTCLEGDIFSIGGSLGKLAKNFETRIAMVKRGDFVILSTDGYYDQFGGSNNTKFLISQFEKLIKESDFSDENNSEILKTAFENWKANRKQTDDVLVAGFKI